MATKKFFAWLDSRSFWHLMKSRGKNKKIPSYFVQPFFREANEVHHEWLKAKIMRRNQWKNFHLHLNCQCRVYWHIDISVIVWILQSIFYLQIFLWYTRLVHYIDIKDATGGWLIYQSNIQIYVYELLSFSMTNLHLLQHYIATKEILR